MQFKIFLGIYVLYSVQACMQVKHNVDLFIASM